MTTAVKFCHQLHESEELHAEQNDGNKIEKKQTFLLRSNDTFLLLFPQFVSIDFVSSPMRSINPSLS